MNFEGHKPSMDHARQTQTEIVSILPEKERALLRQALLAALVKEDGKTADQLETI